MPYNMQDGYRTTLSLNAEINMDKMIFEGNVARLKRRIDQALDNRDEALFQTLSAQLKKLEDDNSWHEKQ